MIGDAFFPIGPAGKTARIAAPLAECLYWPIQCFLQYDQSLSYLM
jgi:hypothetical protein